MDEQTIRRKLKRMALEIAEQNSEEKELLLVAINGNGETVMKNLEVELRAVAPFELQTAVVSLNKKDPLSATLNNELNAEDKVVILIDDVANTGRTLLYAIKPFLHNRPKKIQTLALVERSHKLFPVQTDYAGLSIATTVQEHITVETEGDRISGAWLY